MGKQSTERRGVVDAEDGSETEVRTAYNAGEPAAVGERRVTAQQKERDIAAGLGEAMASRQGRAFLRWLLGECGVYRTSFTGNSTTFFNEGKRDVGLQVLARVTTGHPDAYLTMLKEGVQ